MKKKSTSGNKYAKYNGNHKTPAKPKQSHRKNHGMVKIVGSHRKG